MKQNNTTTNLTKLAEPTPAELHLIQAEESGNTPTILDQLLARQAEVQRLMSDIQSEVQKDVFEIDSAYALVSLDRELKEIEAKIVTERFDSRIELIKARMLALKSEVPELKLKKLLWEEVETETNGVKVINYIVQINDNITTKGKSKAKAKVGNGQGKDIIWKHKLGETITASALLGKVKASNPDAVAMIPGTADVAPDRALQSIQKRHISSLAWLDDWNRVS